jgi:predicted nucleotidyltransferase
VPTSKITALPLPGATTHGGLEATPEELRAAVEDVVAVLRDEGVPFLFVGGIAAGLLGRGRYTGDIDLLVRPEDARRALRALERAAFVTSELNPHWIFKGVRGQVLVDILFTLKGDIRLDDEMLARAPIRSFLGVDVPLLPPEDLIVVKAIVFDEETPRHWYDALGLIAGSPIDWDYLVRRARRSPRRMLSLLVFALSADLLVPRAPIERLHAMVLDDAPDTESAT